MLIFDLETDGFLEDVTVVHSLVIRDEDTGEITKYRQHSEPVAENVADGLKRLQDADVICGHNIIGYDIPVIQKLYPWFSHHTVVDTMVMSSVIYSDLKERDWAMDRKQKGEWIPKNLYGSHSLEAWGQRLGEHKGDYSKEMIALGLDPWAEWNQDMEDYCVQDVQVTAKLLRKLQTQNFSEDCLELEHSVAWIIARQQRKGVLFDSEKAGSLYAVLKQRQKELNDELQTLFPPWEVRLPDFIPKRNNKTQGYIAGVPVPRSKTVKFNPNSEDQVAFVLKRDFNWLPSEFTPSGKPKVSEDVLSTLKYPPVQSIMEYMMVTKRISQLAEGKQAWLKKYSKEGRIHGRVKSNGAVTGRMTHSSPNLGQIPRVGSPFGAECRELFIVPKGYLLVGCDAEGLELRALAHYMAIYDGGSYAKTVVEGKKEDGTDAHTVNMQAIRLRSRDNAKTWFYAFIYGAGDHKLGCIVYDDMPTDSRPKPTDKLMVKLGKESRARLATGLPALGKLTKAVKEKAKQGYLRGLDGRRIPVRSDHAALNTLLQSAGAVIMKKALVLLDSNLPKDNSCEFVLNVHDEFQIECLKEHAEEVAMQAEKSIKDAGEFYNFRCPLAGSSAVGSNWRETH